MSILGSKDVYCAQANGKSKLSKLHSSCQSNSKLSEFSRFFHHPQMLLGCAVKQFQTGLLLMDEYLLDQYCLARKNKHGLRDHTNSPKAASILFILMSRNARSLPATSYIHIMAGRFQHGFCYVLLGHKPCLSGHVSPVL